MTDLLESLWGPFASPTLARDFVYTFIPIFVAMDIAGVIPLYLALTKGLSNAERRQVRAQAVWTALAVSLAFIAVGRLVFLILGITVSDFKIAGGLLLLVLAIVEILSLGVKDRPADLHAGPVPLGTPLSVGPAVLTTLVILIGLRGISLTVLALLANLALLSLAFRYSDRLVKGVGENGLRAVSQVVNLLLAAIAVSMVRRGLQGLWMPQ